MPRKEWIRKNRFCRNSRLDEKSFEFLVHSWFAGHSVRKTAIAMGGLAQLGVTQSPDAKTVAKYMQRFGFVLSEMTLERAFLQEHPKFYIIREEDHALFIETIEMKAQAVVEHSLRLHSYQVFRALYGDVEWLEISGELELEVRRINAQRRGIRPPYRGDVAMAMYRLRIRETLGAKVDRENLRNSMVREFLHHLDRSPMDIRRASFR